MDPNLDDFYLKVDATYAEQLGVVCCAVLGVYAFALTLLNNLLLIEQFNTFLFISCLLLSVYVFSRPKIPEGMDEEKREDVTLYGAVLVVLIGAIFVTEVLISTYETYLFFTPNEKFASSTLQIWCNRILLITYFIVMFLFWKVHADGRIRVLPKT